MKHEHLLLMTILGFFAALVIFVIVFYRSALPRVTTIRGAVKSDTDAIGSLNSKVTSLEKNIIDLTDNQENVSNAIEDVRTYISTTSAKPTAVLPETKSILASANTKGSLFTTTFSSYTPMGMYVNIVCPKSCNLWINFYTSSQNLGNPTSAQGNLNTYGIFLDEADQSIYSQANFPVALLSIPISLNAVIPVSAGFHTIDIRAKTNGGTLQSNVSFLQVLAIEK